MATPTPPGWRRASFEFDCGYDFRSIPILVRTALSVPELLELPQAIREADREREAGTDPRRPRMKHLRHLASIHTQFIHSRDRDLDAETVRQRLNLLLQSQEQHANA